MFGISHETCEPVDRTTITTSQSLLSVPQITLVLENINLRVSAFLR